MTSIISMFSLDILRDKTYICKMKISENLNTEDALEEIL